MKKLILSGFIAIGTMISSSSFAQSIPAMVKASLTKAYPTVKNVHWDKENPNYEAGFKLDGKEMSILMDSKGSILETETAISTKELPAGVFSYLKTKFGAAYKISETAFIVKADGTKIYEAEVKGLDYMFDTSGKFIKAQKD
ncbi:MAG: hypothetical protein KKG25_14825 [Bacteroidetes bacterium]|nr:hypothetical protein [Bacteroidota bacterium]MBU1486120.1 hypothetical protein [Bacteroidota bacterium]